MIQIDLNKCSKCGFCSRVCPAYIILFSKEEGPSVKFPEVCISCGHCIAICPTDAIIHPKMDISDFNPIINPNISYDQYLNLVRNRRSIRRFMKEPISDEDIEKILNSVRYIPTAENSQALKYLIIKDQNQLMEIKKSMYKLMRKLKRLLDILFILKFLVPKRLQLGLKRLVETWEKYGESGKEDPFLRQASTLIIIYAKKSNRLRIWDAGIACQNIMFAAETLGIGTVLNGYHTISVQFSKSVRKASKLPKKHKILASICLGYPAIKYNKTIYRKKPSQIII